MRSQGKPPKPQAIATALDTWADARERAINDLKVRAATLEGSGECAEAARLRSAARHLQAQMMKERRRAAELRDAGDRNRRAEPRGNPTSNTDLEVA